MCIYKNSTGLEIVIGLLQKKKIKKPEYLENYNKQVLFPY